MATGSDGGGSKYAAYNAKRKIVVAEKKAYINGLAARTAAKGRAPKRTG